MSALGASAAAFFFCRCLVICAGASCAKPSLRSGRCRRRCRGHHDWARRHFLGSLFDFAGVKRTFAYTWYGLFTIAVGIAATLATNSTELYIGAMIAGTLIVMIGCYRALTNG